MNKLYIVLLQSRINELDLMLKYMRQVYEAKEIPDDDYIYCGWVQTMKAYEKRRDEYLSLLEQNLDQEVSWYQKQVEQIWYTILGLQTSLQNYTNPEE